MLPRRAAGSESRNQRAVGNRLISEDKGLENTLAPVPPTTGVSQEMTKLQRE